MAYEPHTSADAVPIMNDIQKELVTLKYADIIFDEGIYPRVAGHDPARVQEYAQDIECRNKFSAVAELHSHNMIIGWIFDGKIQFPRDNRDFCESVFEAWLLLGKKERQERRQDVYFIQAEPGTPIKIGISYDPELRLKELQVGNHNKLRVLTIISGGGENLEKTLHDRFKSSRVIGEWFEQTDELLEVIRYAKNN